jgi:hypothetical protein
MSSPEYEPQVNQQPNYWWMGLIPVIWVILSTIALFIASEFYNVNIFYQTFIIVALVSVFGYILLFARYGLIVIPIIMLSGILQCGGCMHWIGYRSSLSSPVRMKCHLQLQQLHLALEQYRGHHGSFPPACVADQSGQPLYSWTVSILPYIEQPFLYKEMRLYEPWNSPHNRRFTDTEIRIFQCPAHKSYWYKKNNHIGYIGVVGPDTAWQGAVGRSLSEFTDGPENTILLFEVASLDIPWAAPPRLDLDQAIELFKKSDPHGPSTRHHPPNISALFADGSVRSLPATISPETMRALLTINGGEKVVIPEPFKETALP